MNEIFVQRRTLPEAWEEAVLECWSDGYQVATQYDKPGDPMSKDVFAVIVVEEPLAEPRLHKCIPMSYGKLEEYRQEVCNGIHDSWIDPASGKWSYTYHQRFTDQRFRIPDPRHIPNSEGLVRSYEYCVNQRANAVTQLCQAPFTRRALQSTWSPLHDAHVDAKDPPCVQYIVDRIWPGDIFVRDVHIRSNDAFKAAFCNIWAFISDMENMAAQVATVLGRPITLGRFRWIADSFHIYGSYFEEFERGFLQPIAHRPWADRVVRSDDPLVVESVESARALIARKELVT